jgi:phosphatidylglycerophosphatase A
MGRPGLVADELLGMTIANYIAGAKGIFEFIRFDQAKPGILKNLGPIVNDAIGGLIAGVSSNMYTRAISEASKQHKR